MALPALTLVVPGSRVIPPDDAETVLRGLYAHDPGVLRVNMVATVDGAAWGPDHLSGSINDDADFRVFRVLRALADVVVVGAGTARAERYSVLDRPEGLDGWRDAPLALALVTRRGEVPSALAGGDRQPYVVTGERGAAAARAELPADRVVVAPGPAGGVDLAAGMAELAARAGSRLLCEGGPHLLADLLAADLVDELCVTTAPLLMGAGPGRIAAGGGVGEPSAHPARLAHLLHDPAGQTLAARWVLDR